MTGGPPTESPSATPGQTFAPPGSPALPTTETRPSDEFNRDADATSNLTSRPAGPVYRTEQQRARSVYRRANPWYRRLTRGVLGLAFLAAGAAALYFGARELQDYLNRDRLPEAGVEIPAYQTTAFQITSMEPSPLLDGTLTIDVNTRAFEYESRPIAGQAQVHVVSPDGVEILVEDGGAWRGAGPADSAAAEIARAIPFLVGVDTADDILINRMRNGFVELVEQETEGIGDNSLERYRVTIDIGGYNAAQPLQWQSFQQEVVPGIGATGETELTFWLDADRVLVRLLHPATNWSWERTGRSEQPIELPDAALAADN